MKKVIFSIIILLIAGTLFASNSGQIIDLSLYSNEELAMIGTYIVYYSMMVPIEFLTSSYYSYQVGDSVEGIIVKGNLGDFFDRESSRFTLEFDRLNISKLFFNDRYYFDDSASLDFLLYGFPTILEGKLDAYYVADGTILLMANYKLLLKTFTNSAIYHVEINMFVTEEEDVFFNPLKLNGREIEMGAFDFLDLLGDFIYHY